MQSTQFRLRLLQRLPRALAVLHAIFLGIFALDVFDAGYGPAGTIAALSMHLIPSFLILVALAVAWNHERAGSLLFLLAAIGFTARFDAYAHPLNFVVLPAPLFLVSLLLYVSAAAKYPIRDAGHPAR